MDDEDEDFQALFFVECEENMTDLQTGLDALLAGERDPEIVNAAFRAVHSVKGGAAAFDFQDVVSFAHGFETVMDRIRSGAMTLTPEICETLLRAADVMTGLLEAARTGGEGPAVRAATVGAQLAALTGAGAPAPAVGAASEIEPEPELAPEVEPAPEAEYAFGAEAEPVTVSVRVVPGPDFLIAGFDPMLMIRAARAHGLVSVAVEGAVPGIEDYVPGSCPLSWKLDFELDGPPSVLAAFFATYGYSAEVAFTPPLDSLPQPGAPTASPPAAALSPAPAAVAPPAEPVAARPAEPTAVEPVPATPPLDEPAPVEVAPVEPETAKPLPPVSAPAEPAASMAEVAQEVPAQASAPAPADRTGQAARPAAAASRSLRVDLERVDRLVNLVGEVLIAQAAVAQGCAEHRGVDLSELTPLVEALSRQTRELQESVMSIRAQPMRSVFSRLPRVVRDLADSLGKEARLVVQGEDVEVDTTVIEELNEPLMHMIRNAMDHGLETPEERRGAGKPPMGTLTLSAEHRGGRVRIVLADDGRGINREAVLAKAHDKGLVGPDEELDAAAIEALIFHPGFSTAAKVSSVSGRGVGMDVVLRKIQALGGRCVVAGNPGKGTTFTITLPLTLAVMDGMAVKVADQQFILPVSSLVEAITVDPARVAVQPDRTRILKLRGALLPLLSLRQALSLPDAAGGPATAVVVDTETDGHVVVMVDALLGQRQIVLKSLEENVGRIEGVGGATVMGDGQVALVLDVPALFRLGAHASADYERMH